MSKDFFSLLFSSRRLYSSWFLFRWSCDRTAHHYATEFAALLLSNAAYKTASQVQFRKQQLCKYVTSVLQHLLSNIDFFFYFFILGFWGFFSLWIFLSAELAVLKSIEKHFSKCFLKVASFAENASSLPVELFHQFSNFKLGSSNQATSFSRIMCQWKEIIYNNEISDDVMIFQSIFLLKWYTILLNQEMQKFRFLSVFNN